MVYHNRMLLWEKVKLLLVTIALDDYFGELDYLLAENSLKRHFTVKALKDCEILVLSKEVRIIFIQVILEFIQSSWWIWGRD